MKPLFLFASSPVIDNEEVHGREFINKIQQKLKETEIFKTQPFMIVSYFSESGDKLRIDLTNLDTTDELDNFLNSDDMKPKLKIIFDEQVGEDKFEKYFKILRQAMRGDSKAI